MLSSIFGDGSPYVKSAWRRTWGGLWDLGSHMMSLYLPVLGPAAEVTAVQGQHQTSHVLVRHAGGAVSTLAVSLTVPKASTGLDVAFLGDSGVAHLPIASAEPDRHWPERLGNRLGPLPDSPGTISVTSVSAGR